MEKRIFGMHLVPLKTLCILKKILPAIYFWEIFFVLLLFLVVDVMFLVVVLNLFIKQASKIFVLTDC